MLPHENNTKKLICIILCAGEGIRIRKYVKDIPKSLITFEKLNNKPILQDTINKLVKCKVSSIIIITGHLKKHIEKYILQLKTNDPTLQTLITLHDSGLEYKKGPLFSFLSILKNEKLQLQNQSLLLLPGDTIFDAELLEEIINKPIKNDTCLLFYREISTEKTGKKKISVIETIKNGSIKKIHQNRTSTLKESSIIKQLIPIVIFQYEILKKIQTIAQKIDINTINAMINTLIINDFRIVTYKVSPHNNFYDIDTESDIKGFNNN